jgi:hypothetical protein
MCVKGVSDRKALLPKVRIIFNSFTGNVTAHVGFWPEINTDLVSLDFSPVSDFNRLKSNNVVYLIDPFF